MSSQPPPPWYYMYAANYLADRRYRVMSLSERGLLLTLLNECWVNESLPSEDLELSKFLGYQVNDLKAAKTKGVMSYFRVHDGSIISDELNAYKAKHDERRRKQVSGGRLGAQRKRVATARGKPAGQPQGLPAGILNSINSTSLNSNAAIKEGELKEVGEDFISAYEAGERDYPL